MSRLLTLILSALVGLGAAVAARAQDAGAPAHVAYVDGQATIEHENTADAATGDTPLLPGDRVRTDAGRVELLLADGSLVQLDEQSALDLLSDGLVRLMTGRAVVVTGGGGQLQVDTPAGSVFIATPGEYHIALEDADGRATLDLSVVRGRADLASDVERLTVGSGQRAWARLGEAPSYPVAFNSAEWDAFDSWSQARLGAHRGAVSYRYVPATLTQYSGAFDEYGAWGYAAPYGYVWYPRVAASWRPYSFGRWRYYGRFGWTWTGGEVWAWPTHHYGRWGVSSLGAWFWIPGGTWGAAYVDWAIAPGYVSWCPLGFDNHAVYGFWGHGGHRGYWDGHDGRGYYDGRYRRGDGPGRGWTIVPRDHFGGRRVASHVAVDGDALLGRRGAPAFALQSAPPRPAAVPRGSVGGAFASRGDQPMTPRANGFAAPRGSGGLSRAPITGVAAPGARGTRPYVAGPAGSATRTPGMAFGRRPLPETGANQRFQPVGPRRDGGTITTDNGSRVYRVAPAVPRGAVPASPVSPSYDRPRTAPAARGPVAVPRGGAESRAWSPDQVQIHRGPAIESQGAWGAPRSAPAVGGSYGRSAPVGTPWRGAGAARSPGVMAVPRGDYQRAPMGRVAPPAPPAYRGPAASASRGSAPGRQAPAPSGAGAVPRGGGDAGHHRRR